MRIKRTICTLLCAASVVGTPIMAQSLSPSARIAASSSVKRVALAVKKESKLGGDSTLWILGLVGLGIFVGLIVLDDDEPTSP